MVQRIEGSVTYNQAFDAENRLVSVARVGGGPTAFGYDADGQRVKTVKASGATVYTPFPDFEEELNGAAVIRRSTYRLAGQFVANDGTAQVYNLFGLDLISQDSGREVRELWAQLEGATRFLSGELVSARMTLGFSV